MTNALTRISVKEERTALHYAAFNGNIGFVVLLLDRLRDALLKDRWITLSMDGSSFKGKPAGFFGVWPMPSFMHATVNVIEIRRM